jgi:ribosome-associated heat shock protein Hsp15
MQAFAKLRIDKWLWAARFFKTRQLAAEAVSGGKVHVNGQRCKPSKTVQIGTELRIRKEVYHWQLHIVGLNNQRRPASEASLLYEECPESYQHRQQQAIEFKQQRSLLPHAVIERRPTKKQRRQIHRFKQT